MWMGRVLPPKGTRQLEGLYPLTRVVPPVQSLRSGKATVRQQVLAWSALALREQYLDLLYDGIEEDLVIIVLPGPFQGGKSTVVEAAMLATEGDEVTAIQRPSQDRDYEVSVLLLDTDRGKRKEEEEKAVQAKGKVHQHRYLDPEAMREFLTEDFNRSPGKREISWYERVSYRNYILRRSELIDAFTPRYAPSGERKKRVVLLPATPVLAGALKMAFPELVISYGLYPAWSFTSWYPPKREGVADIVWEWRKRHDQQVVRKIVQPLLNWKLKNPRLYRSTALLDFLAVPMSWNESDFPNTELDAYKTALGAEQWITLFTLFRVATGRMEALRSLDKLLDEPSIEAVRFLPHYRWELQRARKAEPAWLRQQGRDWLARGHDLNNKVNSLKLPDHYKWYLGHRELPEHWDVPEGA